MRIRININISVGRIVKFFVLSDLVLFAGWGLVQPIFAIFIVENIEGATLVTVGTFAAIYWLLKSVLQLFIARRLDSTPGEKDDFYALISGMFIASISALLFVLINKVWQLYLVQAVYATAMALYFASFPAIFSRHLDKEKVSFNWVLDSSAVGIAAGISGVLGGVLAKSFGFEIVFILVAVFSAAAALILLLVPDLVLPKTRKAADVPPEIKGKPPTPIGH